MARKTGPTQQVIQLVHERAGGICEICGWHEHQQTHHRSARRAGGTRLESINYPTNLLALCAPCHRRVESNRLEALDYGWLVSSWQESAKVPVKLRGTWKLLDMLGGYQLPG